MLPAEREVTISVILSCPFFWSEQVAEEQVEKSVLLHVGTLGVFLTFFNLVHRNQNSFSSGLLLNFSTFYLNLFVHASKALHRRRVTSVRVTLPVAGSSCGCVRGLCTFASWANRSIKFLGERRNLGKEFQKVDLHNCVGRDVWSFVFKAAMHKNCRVNGPNAVAESLKTVELAPFT